MSVGARLAVNGLRLRIVVSSIVRDLRRADRTCDRLERQLAALPTGERTEPNTIMWMWAAGTSFGTLVALPVVDCLLPDRPTFIPTLLVVSIAALNRIFRTVYERQKPIGDRARLNARLDECRVQQRVDRIAVWDRHETAHASFMREILNRLHTCDLIKHDREQLALIPRPPRSTYVHGSTMSALVRDVLAECDRVIAGKNTNTDKPTTVA